MNRIQLFHATLDGARELEETPFRDEKELQKLVERHLRDLTGIDFVKSEHRTGSRHKRRADTLGIDGQQRPVVVEYKLGQGGGAISQGLDYLYWLEDHKGDFRELVRDNLGSDRSRNIDFKGARLLCIAGEFKREDVINADTNTRQIELLCVRRLGESTILLEWVLGRDTALKVKSEEETRKEPRRNLAEQQSSKEPDYSIFENWEKLKANPDLFRLFENLREYICSLGSEVLVNPTKYYISFKTSRHTIAYVFPQTNRLKVFVNADLEHTVLRENFIRKLPEDNAYPPCNAQIFVYNQNNLEEAQRHLLRSYDESG